MSTPFFSQGDLPSTLNLHFSFNNEFNQILTILSHPRDFLYYLILKKYPLTIQTYVIQMKTSIFYCKLFREYFF